MSRAAMAAAVRIVIKHPGELRAFGYTSKAPAADRRAALRRASSALGWHSIISRLNALYVFNKYRRPALARLFRADRQFASARLAATQ